MQKILKISRHCGKMFESLQKGRHSVVAEQGGLLSPHWEVSVRKFQELIVNSIRPALIKNSIQKVENA